MQLNWSCVVLRLWQSIMFEIKSGAARRLPLIISPKTSFVDVELACVTSCGSPDIYLLVLRAIYRIILRSCIEPPPWPRLQTNCVESRGGGEWKDSNRKHQQSKSR